MSQEALHTIYLECPQGQSMHPNLEPAAHILEKASLCKQMLFQKAHETVYSLHQELIRNG
jgi:hypothetical protein